MQRKILFSLLPILSLTLALGVTLINLSGVVGAQGPGAQAIGTAFTYQGRLTDADEPADRDYDFRFVVYNAASGGSQVGAIVTREDVTVADGFFAVELDPGSGVFTGDPRYLEIGVRAGDSTGGYTLLSPRQPLLPAPYAMYAQNIPLAGTGSATTAARSDHDHDGTYAPAASMVPSGAVMFFNLSTCPSGWHELTDARGRYLTGLPAGGTLAASVGTALSNQENRAVGRHNHSIWDPGHNHSINDPGHQHYIPDVLKYDYDEDYGDRDGLPHYFDSRRTHYTNSSTTGISILSHTTGISINYNGSVNGTNAPYLQLLVCQKD
jgi:hypothetical protein